MAAIRTPAPEPETPGRDAATACEARLIRGLRKTLGPRSGDAAALAGRLTELLEGTAESHLLAVPAGDRPYLVGRTYSRLHSGAGHGVGSFFTPAWVARRLLALAASATPAAPLVFDPACGAGALLLAARERFPGARLVGWDTDQHALDLARVALGADAELEVRDAFAPSDWPSADLIVLNPPYGTALPPSARALVPSSRYAGREPDLFALLLERCRLRAPRAVTAAVLPAVVCMQPEYRALRDAESPEGLQALVWLPFGAFPEATVQPVLALFGAGAASSTVPAVDAEGAEHALSREGIGADPERRWQLDGGGLTACLVRLRARFPALGAIAACHEGVHTGNVRHKLFTEDASAPGARPLLKGADVQRFRCAHARRWLRYDPTLVDRAAGEYASLRDPRVFLAPKLLSRQTSDHLVVALDESDAVTDNSLHTVRLHVQNAPSEAPSRPDGEVPPTPEVVRDGLRWLAIVLNSTALTALYRHESGERARPLAQIKLRLLRSLPIPPRPAELGGAALERLCAVAHDEERDAIVEEALGLTPAERTAVRRLGAVRGAQK